MSAIEDAVKEAVEKGGYERFSLFALNEDSVVADLEKDVVCLDPLFWQALGKARGWNEGGYEVQWSFCGDLARQADGIDKSRYMWHGFIDHLASGGDPNSFFKGIV